MVVLEAATLMPRPVIWMPGEGADSPAMVQSGSVMTV
jgi:hypothetical protein